MRRILLALFIYLGAQSISAGPITIVQHLTKVKILESNMVSIRPGSIYENKTNFELLFGLFNPEFNYRFVDTGLGTADPIYPIYQKGYQGSWFQLLFAAFGEKFSRHIDHSTSLPTPEGCFIDSAYLLRNISEFPKTLYQKERAEGFKQIVIRLEHYTEMWPGAECGRHRTNPPDPKFNPMKFLKANLKAKQLSDFPQNGLARFEAHVAAIRHLTEEFSKTKWTRFDMNLLKTRNSLWYYQDGIPEAYGLNNEYRLGEFENLSQPADLVHNATEEIQSDFVLDNFISPDEFSKMLKFLKGKPTPEFDAQKEPANDTLDLKDVTPNNIYTSGLYMERIENAEADVSSTSNYRLVGITLQPAITQEDMHFSEALVPQLRLVFQMMNPRQPDQPLEQLFFHLNFDVVQRHSNEATQIEEHRHFLAEADELAELRKYGHPDDYQMKLKNILTEFTQIPVRDFSFSSALTGIWTFGVLSRNYNKAQELLPIQVVREGINFGYYSSIKDNDLFRSAIATTTGSIKQNLKSHMEDLRLDEYRDPKRMNVNAVRFNRMTCAQCHHLSARDGVHMSFNDHLDSRIKDPTRVTEFVYHEAERQLKMLENNWDKFFPQ